MMHPTTQVTHPIPLPPIPVKRRLIRPLVEMPAQTSEF
jgi:hypothetical protein